MSAARKIDSLAQILDLTEMEGRISQQVGNGRLPWFI